MRIEVSVHGGHWKCSIVKKDYHYRLLTNFLENLLCKNDVRIAEFQVIIYLLLYVGLHIAQGLKTNCLRQ
jgi:hypothetical protein